MSDDLRIPAGPPPPRWVSPEQKGWDPEEWTEAELTAAYRVGLPIWDLIKTHGDWELWAGRLLLGYIYQAQGGQWIWVLACGDESPGSGDAPTLDEAKAQLEAITLDRMPAMDWENQTANTDAYNPQAVLEAIRGSEG